METTQVYKIKQIADVSDVLESIEKIKKSLGQLNLSPSVQNSFDRLFSNMERQSQKASDAMVKGFKKKGTLNSYGDALGQISNIYDEIVRKISTLDNKKVVLNADSTDLENFKKEVEALDKEIKGLESGIKNIKKSFKDFDEIASRRGEGGKGSNQDWRQFIDAYKEGDVEAAGKAYKKLSDNVAKAQAKIASGKGGNKEYWEQYAQDLEKFEEPLKDLTEKTKELNEKQDQLTVTSAKIDGIYNRAGDAIKNTGDEVKETAKGFKEYGKEAYQAAESTNEFESEIEKFKDKAKYFFGISNAINLVKRAVRSAYDTVKDLDAVMTETAVVTNFNVGDMWSQLPQYTQRANELGVSIHSAYEAATIFYQQGLKTNEVMAISNETLKMARIAGLDAATASDRMTNALRGFNMEMDELSAQRVNDVYSKLAAITASNTDEIPTAMTKVASLAHSANMEFETTSAFLAQMIETTRESAETAGTALKTVVARFSEVKKLYSQGDLMGSDEEGEEIDVNKVSTALRSAGINLNEYLSGAKGLDDIFIELAEKWDGLDIVQQRYIATMAAGSRQQSRFIAMMSDYKRTMELVDAANNANGASNEQYAKTLDSLETKLSRLKNAWDEFILGLANSDLIKKVVDLLTDALTTINKIISTLSGNNSTAKMLITFFGGFASFKMGASLFKQNNGLSKTLEKYLGSGVEVSGKNLAARFYGSMADKIINLQNGSMLDSIKKPFAEIGDYFSKDIQFNADAFLDKIDINELGSVKDVDKFVNAFGNLEEGKTTVSEFNQTMEECGISLKITNKNAEEFGFEADTVNQKVGKTADTMKVTAAACTAVGAAFIGIGSAMEQQEGPMKNFGSVIKALGIGLTTFGTIMSVYLPLQAQLMANKVTGAIVSIPIVGIIAGIISVLTALGVAIYNFAKNNSAEAKLKRMEEAAKASSDAANEAKEAYEKLGEAWESLDDKYEAIENAVAGTKAWRDAISEVNNEVLELVELYEDLEIERDENGILKITNREDFDRKQKEGSANAAIASNVGKIRTYQADWNKDKKGLGNAWEGEAYYKDFIEDMEAKGRLSDIATMSDKEIEKLLQESVEQGITHDDNLYYINIDEIRDYANKYKEKEQKASVNLTGLGSVILGASNVTEGNLKYANAFLNEGYLSKITKDAIDQSNDLYSEDLEKAYREAGGTNKDASVEEMRNLVAASIEREKGIEQLNAFLGKIGSLSGASKALFEQSNGGALTWEQREELLKYDENNKKVLFTSLGGEDVFGDYTVFSDWFDESIKYAGSNFDITSFSKTFQSKLDEGLIKGLDSGTFKNFVDNMNSIYISSGSKGVEEIQNSIRNMTAGFDSEKMNQFMNALSSVNWSSAESIRTLSDLAEEFGISTAEFDELEKKIIELNKAAARVDLEKVKNIFSLITNLKSGKQERGFSEEDYKTLLQSGASEKDFVYNVETQAYDYIGGDLQTIINLLNLQLGLDEEQLKKEIASGEAAREASESTGPIDENNYGQLRGFIQEYIRKAGENSIVSEDLLYSGTPQELREAYNRIMATSFNLEDNKANYKVVREGNLQSKTGAELAAEAKAGDEDAKRVLKQQYQNSGASAKGVGLAQMGSIVDVVQSASKEGISVEDLNTYVETLKKTGEYSKLTTAQMYQLALSQSKVEAGMKALADSQDDWMKLKKKDGSIQSDGSAEQNKILSDLIKNTEKMLGLSGKLPDNFFKSTKNVELLGKAIDGNKEALAQLQAEVLKTDIGNKFGKNSDEIKNGIDNLAKEIPDLKIGATFDEAPAAKALAEILLQAGATTDEIQKYFSEMGWDFEGFEYEQVTLEEAAKSSTTGYVTTVNPETGETSKIPTDSITQSNSTQVVTVPKPKGTFHRPPKAPKSPSTKSSGGGGGSKKKKSYWENPYDELYNLQQKINEALRTRETLERRYQKLLKQEQATLSDIRQAYYSQITNLRSEAELQRQFAQGRLNQINKLGSQIYTDENGNRKTFSSMGVTKYATYNEETGLLTIDWEGLDALSKKANKTTEGKAAEAYISKLEELVESYEGVRDKLWEIEDQIEEIREAAVESYLSFEDRVLEALVNQYQKEIDSFQSMSDALEKADNEVIDSLREQVDLSRQIRDNTEKEKDISNMENRLAYLQRDTSGANALEIQKLQKDLENAREGYADTLIDQAINKMQEDATNAAEQRNRQIETLNEQLQIMQDTGALWEQVYELMEDAASGDGALSPKSKLVELLKGTEAFESLSNIGQAKWWSEVAEEFHKAWIGKDEAEDKYKVDANNSGRISNTNTQNSINETASLADQFNTSVGTTTQDTKHASKDKYGVALAAARGGYGWGEGETLINNLKNKGFDPNEIQGIIDKVWNDTQSNAWSGKYFGIKDLSAYKLSKFKTGGLADFTGPAWLDGSKTHPELVLNAQDSKNFIALKDILASLMSIQGPNSVISGGGDNYFNIDITADIGSDYDVDRLAERIKKQIYNDGQYRNVNTMSYLR